MTSPTASTNWNLPFDEAIKATNARGVVFPAKYYGELQGIHRSLNFSIAGVTSLDQLQGVLNSLTEKLENGASFAQWQKDIRVQDLGLPKHRIDNIYRTNIQSAYNRGSWEQYKINEKHAPYLMYDAINDSRVRPAHLAMDGIIRRIDDPFWASNYAPNGFRCRCRTIAMSEKQAKTRSANGAGLNKQIDDTMKPDVGWDYNVGENFTFGIDKAIIERKANPLIHHKLISALEKKLDCGVKIIEREAFSEFVDVVLKPDYVIRDTIMKAGDLPAAIVAKLGLETSAIHVSDAVIIDSPFSIDVLKELPDYIEKSTLSKTKKLIIELAEKSKRGVISLFENSIIATIIEKIKS